MVAIKVGHVASALVRDRFRREAAALAAIDRPHVPALHQHGVLEDGRPYLVMDYLDSPTLGERAPPRLAGDLEPAGQQAQEPNLGWLRTLCDAVLANLCAVHEGGIVHLDVKPDNIFVTDEDTGRATGGSGLHTTLADFGLCRVMAESDGCDEAATPPKDMVLGSVEYMAPEHIAGRADLGVPADIYSFGVILYELITGRLPFSGDRDTIARGHMTLRPPRPSLLAAIPASLESLCLACLHKKPEERPADAHTLRRELDRALRDDLPVRAVPAAPGSEKVKLLAGARHPVVLMAAEGSLPRSAVMAATERHKGFVARLQGQRYVCAFSGTSSETPMQDALAAARELCSRHSARVTLHIAELKLRPGRGGRPPKVYGAAVDRPETWLPAAPWSEIYLTPGAAEVLQEPTERSHSDPRFYLLAPEEGSSTIKPPPAAARLLGRDHILARARASVRACLRSATPRMFTILGEHGLGKTRLCGELVGLIGEEAPDAEVIAIRATKPTAGSPSPTWSVLVDSLREITGSDTATSSGSHEDHRPSLQRLGDELRRRAGRGPLALIIDDIHCTSDAVLDLIEYATLDGEPVSLWIAVAGLPRFERRRPQWGARAQEHERVLLEPLSEPDAMELAVALLRPAEYPPPAILQQLAEWAAGNPYFLTALITTLKRAGMVRQGRQQGSWYVAAEELANLPALPVGQWLAERELGRLSPELAACVRVCAVLGSAFLRDELAWVQRAAEIDQVATTSIDIDVGLEELRRRGILVPVGGTTWGFREVLFQDGIYKLIGRSDRAEIHRSALEFWRDRASGIDAERALSAVARHAKAAGDDDTAASACVELGRRARVQHRYVDADVHYSRALELSRDQHRARCIEALRGRGKVRYRLQRIHESIQDLRAARQLAEAAGDDAAIADLLLEEATALDWAGKYEESAEVVGQAQAVIERIGGRTGDAADSLDPRLRGRYLMARGRSCYRQDRRAQAVSALTRARRLVLEHQDDETAIITLVLLGPLLVQIERLDQAEQCFDEVIGLCERTGDRFHLCVAHLNRAWLWLARCSVRGAMNDLRRAQQLARELGQPILERGAVHNLAELLHWSGEHDKARGPAQRAYALQRFLPDPVATGALLLGRVLAACGDFERARELAARARELLGQPAPGQPPGCDHIAAGMLELTLAEAAGTPSAAAWDELAALAAAHVPTEELIEVYYFRARMAVRGERWSELTAILSLVESKLHKCPIWRPAFYALAPRHLGRGDLQPRG